MDTAFWLGVVVTTVLAVPASILANLLQARLLTFLDSRKLVSQEKRRAEAFKFHAIIEDLKSGRKDKYIYMLGIVSSVTVSLVTTLVPLTGASVIVALSPIPVLNPLHKDFFALPVDFDHSVAVCMVLFFFTLSGLFGLYFSSKHFHAVTNALENFDAFQAEFRAKWGDTSPL